MYRTTHRVRARAVLTALALLLVLLPFGPRPAGADHGPAHVVEEDGVNGCMGVRTTPGSENTDKVLVGGSPNPGESVTFEISYPVDADDVAGRETFVITDCVFINNQPVQKFSVSFVPNTEQFVLTFDLTIPEDAPLGAEYCNYAKTTAAPSESQASNRKAGPACFRIGGDLRILKVDEAGGALTGATFDISCTPPGPTPPVIIQGVTGNTATGVQTDADGAITITGPQGTECLVTEVTPPPGYELADPAFQLVTIGEDGPNITFVNTRATGDLTITKTVAGGTGTFTFTVECDGTDFDQQVTITEAQLSATGTFSVTIEDIPTGTVCTVTETGGGTGFTTVVVPTNGTVTIDTGGKTVAFTNTRQTGGLTITKTVAGGTGTFTFTVECDGTAFDQQVTITEAQLSATGTFSVTITGIPTGTVCTVTETSNPDFTTVVVPAGGTVTIDTDGETVAFENTFIPEEPPPTGGEGCTPGFWKNHPEAWTGFTTDQTLGSVFTSLTNGVSNATLLEALDFEGGNNLNGAKRILLRAAVAALLNSTSPDVDYPRTTLQVITAVNTALESGSRSTMLSLASALDADNNLGCPQ